MKIPNFSYRDMAIYNAADMENSLQILWPELTFQVGYSQLKEIRELD